MRRTERVWLALFGFVLLLSGPRCEAPGGPAGPSPSSKPLAASVDTPAATPTPEISAVSGSFDGCPAEGTAFAVQVKHLNELKNRGNDPTDADIDHSVTLAAVLASGDDQARWDATKAAEIEAYVVNVKPGGKETTNCAATDLPHEDTHIELVLGPSDSAKSRRVIVEVTPRWRAAMQAQGVDWSTDQLKASIEGHWVKVRGWLFFDAQHKGQSENTAPGKPGDWRATAWEIHPVTSIQVVPGP